MAGLDDLIAQIPIQDIASKLGVEPEEVSSAVQQLVPALVGGLQVNAEQDPDAADKIAGAAEKHAASGLIDGGVTIDDVDPDDGDKIVSKIFGGNNSESVASALSGGGALGRGLVQKLLPMLAPIVLAYIGKQFANRNAPAAGEAAAGAQASGGGGLGDVLGQHPGRRRWRWRQQPAGQQSSAVCSAARAAPAIRSGRSSAACSAARGNSHTAANAGPRSSTAAPGSGAFASVRRAP